MRKVRVRPHYRNLPRRSKHKSSDRYFFRAVSIGILFFVLLYFLNRISLQAYFAIAPLGVCGLLLFGSIKISRIQQQRKRKIKNRNYQDHMRQIQTQVQDQQKRKRLARAKTLGDMLAFSPGEFEEFVGILFGSTGYRDVACVGKSGDLGADLLAYDARGNLVIVQCKKYSKENKIGTPELQKFVGAIVHYKAQKGIFVTTSLFTKHAEEYVKDKPMIQLIDGQKLVSLVRNVL